MDRSKVLNIVWNGKNPVRQFNLIMSFRLKKGSKFFVDYFWPFWTKRAIFDHWMILWVDKNIFSWLAWPWVLVKPFRAGKQAYIHPKYRQIVKNGHFLGKKWPIMNKNSQGKALSSISSESHFRITLLSSFLSIFDNS